MISRYRLLHPSRYVPILLAVAAVVMLVPADTPTGDGTETASGSVLAVAATQPPVHEEPAVRVAEVSQRPPPEEVVAAAPATTAPVAAAAATPPGELVPQQAMPSAGPEGTAATSLDEPPAANAEAAADGAEEEQRYQIARVGGSALNVRAGPSSANKKLFVLRPGEPVRVAEMDGNWARIIRADGDEGWAYARYLSWRNGSPPAEAATANSQVPANDPEDTTPRAATVTENSEEPAPADGAGRYARMGSDVAARSAPSPGAPQLFVVPAGERVKIAEIRGPWVRIVTNGGVSGWVRFR